VRCLQRAHFASIQLVTPRDQIIWNLAMGLAEVLHECSHRFPPEERYESARQLRGQLFYKPTQMDDAPHRAAVVRIVNVQHTAVGRTVIDKRVMRGGAWNSSADTCRATARFAESPGIADACFARDTFGFRCVRRPAPQELALLQPK